MYNALNKAVINYNMGSRIPYNAENIDVQCFEFKHRFTPAMKNSAGYYIVIRKCPATIIFYSV